MKAILLADRQSKELQPLTKRTCVALLPIAAKPLIHYTLDSLVETNIREILIILSAHSELVKADLGNGERWGLQFDYFLSRGQEEPAKILGRLGAKLSDSQYLLVRADMLRALSLEDFLQAVREAPTSIVATVDKQNAGVSWLRKQTTDQPWLDSNQLQWENLEQPVPVAKEMVGKISRLQSFRAYHQANLEVAAGEFPNLVLPPGQTIHDQLRVGRRSLVPARNRGLVGAYSRVHPQAHLIEKVVLSDEVVVDRDTLLSSTIVLPGTYVGEGVELRNAIVWGNLLIRVDSGAIIQIIDKFLLADLKSESISSQVAGFINRSLGIFVGLFSLPLWPLAGIAAYWQNPQQPLRKIKLRGNLIWRDSMGIARPQEFIAWEWATDFTLLRHLPKLWAVITGQVRMVGVTPQAPPPIDLQTTDWEQLRNLAPVGLIGPSQLTVPPEAPPEEHLLVEAYYARTRHLGTDLLWLFRGFLSLFSKRAW